MLCTHKQAIPFVMCSPWQFHPNPDESKMHMSCTKKATHIVPL